MDELYDEFIEKTDYLTETKGLLKDRINSLGGSITSGTTFRDYLVWLDSLYEALDEKTITGLPDSLEGKCEQDTTPSKNLFNEIYPNIVNGTTKYISLYVGDGTFTMSSNVPLPSNDPYASLFFITGQATSGASTGGNGVYLNRPITIASTNGYVTIGYRIYGGINPEDYQTQVEKGSSATSWEKYTGPVPNPNNHRPINITTGRQVVSVAGKNLFSGVFRQGTNSNLTTANRVYCDSNYYIEQGKTYTFSTNMDTSVYRFAINISATPFPSSTLTYDSGWKRQASFTFTASVSGYLGVPISRVNNANFTPSEIEDIEWQLELGNTPSSYEEYKGNDYEINLGKNLLPSVNTTRTINGITFTHNADGSITANGTATNNAIYPINVDSTTITRNVVLENGTYIFNDGVGDYTNYFCQITNGTNYYNSGNNGIGKTPAINVSNSNPFSFVIYVRSGKTLNNVVFKPQIEKGTQATSYSPYKTPIYLGKIGTYQDYIFRNTPNNPLYNSNLEEGQWYIHKEIGRVVLNGSESWVIDTSHSRYSLTGFITDYMINQRTTAKCNYYRYGDTTQDGYFALSGANNVLFMHYPTSSTNTLTLFKTWLSTNNVELYYVLATPTNTLIEDEELINQLNEIEIFTVISEDFYN